MKSLLATCRCGQVTIEADGPPILSAACYCSDCQEAGRRLEQLASAPPLLGPDGGSEIVLFRKDRVRCVAGQDQLEEHRLKPDSPTRRLVATCCNSAMVLDFSRGHWLSMYRNRFADAPPVEMRIMTKARPVGVDLSDDTPSYPEFSGRFVMKLIGAWVAMGLRTPRIAWGKAPPAQL